MTQWRVEPAAASAVADTVAEAGETLSTTDSGDGMAFSERTAVELGNDLDQGEQLVQSGVAVMQLLEAEGQNITTIMNAISGATVGLRSVVALYEHAGAEMSSEMSQAQTEAVAAAESGDFSFFLPEE
jgi:hypothetical protein